ncbi:MAG: hypothetical protein ACTS5I_15130 [Rhodanobacter sp.]
MDTASVRMEHRMGELVSGSEALNHFRQRWGDSHFSAVPIYDTCNLQVISPPCVLTHVGYIGQLITLEHKSVRHVEQFNRISGHLIAPKFSTTAPQLTMNLGDGGRDGLI